jgi:hypothetical protein
MYNEEKGRTKNQTPDSVNQNPYYKTDSFPATHKIPYILYKPQSSSPFSQQPTPGFNLEPIQSNITKYVAFQHNFLLLVSIKISVRLRSHTFVNCEMSKHKGGTPFKKIDSVNQLQTYLIKIRFNVILRLNLGHASCLSVGFPYQNSVCISLAPSNLIVFEYS